MSIKGYKVFNPDWTCKGFKYKVGETYIHDGEIKPCKSEFHFCRKLNNCFDYYAFNVKNKVAEIEAIGDIVNEEFKSVTNKLKIVRELTWNEVLELCNTGDYNTGNRNTGYYNTGYRNTGDYNTGNRNTGYYNTGYWNTGYYNTGDRNTGNRNTGDYNTGNRNTGYYNTGDFNTGSYNVGSWNETNYSSGFFNTKEQPIYLFNKPCLLSRSEIYDIKGIKILNRRYINNQWISENDMTDEEKKANPKYKITGGYLKSVDFKTACKTMWNELSAEEKSEVKKIPNFNEGIFFEITGIDADKD